MLEPILNPIWVTAEALNGPQKSYMIEKTYHLASYMAYMVLYGMFSQPYSQYPVRERASCGPVYPFCLNLLRKHKTGGNIALS